MNLIASESPELTWNFAPSEERNKITKNENALRYSVLILSFLCMAGISAVKLDYMKETYML